MLNFLLSPIARIGGAVLAVLTVIGAIYGKGRRDVRQKLEAENNADILDRTQKAISAGDAVSRDPSRLRENDGHRRD